MKFIIRSAIAGLLSMPVVLNPASGMAQSPDESVLSVLEELRKGQEEMRKELAEIRKLVTPPPAPSAVEKLKAPAQLGSVPARGNQGARLTIIEFSDYQCPYCKRHVDQTMPRLLEDYVNKGTVRYAFRDYPLSEIHPLAARRPKPRVAQRIRASTGKCTIVSLQTRRNCSPRNFQVTRRQSALTSANSSHAWTTAATRRRYSRIWKRVRNWVPKARPPSSSV